MPAVDAPEVPPRQTTVRDRYLRFIARHDIPWEVTMAVLAIVYVGVGFAADDAPPAYQPALSAVETTLTVLFAAEFVSRFLASHDRSEYLRGHWVDAVALIPVARGLRVFRLIRLLRLIRAFAGLNRVMNGAERLANHKGMGTLVVALVATVVIASAAFYAVESGANPAVNEPGDAMWWGVMTLAGGSTEISAVTDEGRVTTVVLLVLGVALLAGLTATVVSFVLTSGRDPEAPAPDAHLRDLARLREAGVMTDAEFTDFVVRVSRRL